MANGNPTLWLLALVLATSPLAAQDAGKTDEAPAKRIGITFGGAFEAFDITGPIEGAKTTKMAAQYEWSFGVRPFTKKTWDERGLEWETFLPVAQEVADTVAAKLQPKLVRDHRGIVLSATHADADPSLTHAILSPTPHARVKESPAYRHPVTLYERDRIPPFSAHRGNL